MTVQRREFLKASAALSLGGACLERGAFGNGDSPTALTIGNKPQLFLDGFVVETSRGCARALHLPVKKGLIQEADGAPWDRGGVVSVVRDRAGLFHMYYCLLYWDASVRDLSPSIGEDKAHWFRIVPCYAVSDDGVRWRKPKLGLVSGPTGFRPAPKEKWTDGIFEEPVGLSTDNNQGCPIATIQDLQTFGNVSDTDRRFLVNVIIKDDSHAFAKTTDAGLYFCKEVPDIVGDPDWRKKLTPIWEGVRSGPRGAHTRVTGFDNRAKEWFECDQCSFGHIVKDGRQISRWTSKDLLEWSSEQIVLSPGDGDSRTPSDHVEYMTISVRHIGGAWLGFLNVFHGDRSDSQGEMPTRANVWRKGLTELRLIISRNAGRTWQRVAGTQPWLSPHERENGFDRLIGMCEAMVRVGDEFWHYYGCWDGDHLAWNKDGTTYYKDRARIWRTGLATLRYNGFVSLDAAGQQGEVLTKPMLFSGRDLQVNLAAPKGTLRVEIADASGQSIPGYGAGDCEPLRGDGVSLPVRWRERTDVAGLAGKAARLRFSLNDASLYGFQLV